MRTTLDLPDDLHRAAVQIARDRHQTLSRTVSDLLRAAIAGGARDVAVRVDAETGLPVVSVGRAVTAEDVAAAQDDG